MALVLVMFPGLQQPGLYKASSVNITICKGIQTYNTSDFQRLEPFFSFCIA